MTLTIRCDGCMWAAPELSAEEAWVTCMHAPADVEKSAGEFCSRWQTLKPGKCGECVWWTQDATDATAQDYGTCDRGPTRVAACRRTSCARWLPRPEEVPGE